MKAEHFSPGDRSAGFELLSSREMPEYSSRALHFRHQVTGCEVFHLHNDDPENLFAFAFRTPPLDDTGASHILEHSVLCGSRRFPMKDPFVVLLKSSLQTFLNAFTFPDKTVFPASSMVARDFFNLMLVTGDAVFFPLLRKEVFMQEAHHLELSSSENSADGLMRTGVVFNEMKGVFSSPESVVADASLRSLFPDSPYGFESGGHPRAIAALTPRRLRDYHRRFYHPGNCRVFLYGNIATLEVLEFLEENFLSAFGPAQIDSEVGYQPRWDQPRRMEKTFPAEQGKSTVTLNWLTAPVLDPLKLLSFEVLSELLVGNEGAPLHRALLESKLGDDLSPATGLDTELNELVFTVGLRGTGEKSTEAVEALILDTLQELAEGGIPEDLVQAALHRVEFRNTEIQRGGRPYSLTLMRRALRGWLHGADPETTLEFRCPMDALKAETGRGGYFERLIEAYLLVNPHRSTLLIRPDPGQQRREEEEESQELLQLGRKLDLNGRKRVSLDLQRLRTFQQRPDGPRVLARIPALHLRDLRREVQLISTERPAWHIDCPLLFHDLHTNGVVYLDLAFDTSRVAEPLLHLLPLFRRAVRGSGLPGIPYYDVARLLSLRTGGFGASLSADTPVSATGGVKGRMVFRVKMLERNLEEAVDLVRELLLRADFHNLERLRTIVQELTNDLRASLVPGGSHFASLRASARLSAAAAIEEKWKGVSQYLWLAGLNGRLEDNLSGLAAALETVRAELISPSLLTVNLTCEQAAAKGALSAAAELVEALGQKKTVAEDRRRSAAPFPPLSMPASSVETLVGSMNVSFVAHAIHGSPFDSREHAHEAVLAHFLSTGFLWERLRMRGGAYGAGASANGLEALFGFSSYRDPNMLGTLDGFKDALRFASSIEVEPRAFEQVVLGAAGKEDRPMAPGEKGFVALSRESLGVTDDLRQARRDGLIDCTPQQLKSAAERLLGRFDRGATAIVTHAKALEREKRRLEEMKAAVLAVPD